MSATTDEVDVLLWCMRPPLDLYRLRGPLPESIRELPPRQRPFRPATHSRYRDFFVATETANQALALARALDGASEPVAVTVPEEAARGLLLDMKPVRVARARMAKQLKPLADPAVVDSLENQLYKVAIARSIYRRMKLRNYAGVLVSTQHSPIIRALIAAAHEQSVPVVYVPHAPVGDNGAYLDLPVSYAGLRGDGEREFYRDRLGVPIEQLHTVGNLASDVLEMPLPEIAPGSPGVLALSPLPHNALRRAFDVLAHADLGEMIIAPHPRSDLAEIQQLAPVGWRVNEEGRTLDLLKQGPAFLLQLSSGVAWESAALGIPTATVRIDEDPLSYPFLADEAIYPAVRTPEQATAFALSARSGGIDRDGLRDHALHWCGIDGPEAAHRLDELLTTVAAASGTRAPQLHDGWGAGGGALQRSWLRGSRLAPKR